MSDIEKLLANAADLRKTHPISVNAEDLFFKGHITAEEYAMVYKSEHTAMSIKSDVAIPDSDCYTRKQVARQGAEHNNLRITGMLAVKYISDAIAKAEKMVDDALEEWFPHQINYTIIRTKRDSIRNDLGPNLPTIPVRIVLINVEKETQQSLGTNISLDLALLVGDEIQDEIFWEHFQYALQNQFTTILLQLVKAIKTGNFGMNQ